MHESRVIINEKKLSDGFQNNLFPNINSTPSTKNTNINFEQAILFYKQESIRSSQIAAECKNILSQNRLELSKLKNEISICEGQNAELLVNNTNLLKENENLKKEIQNLKFSIEEYKATQFNTSEMLEIETLKSQIEELQLKYQALKSENENLQKYKINSKNKEDKQLIEENNQLKTKLEILSNVVVFPDNVIRETFSIMAMKLLNTICASFKSIHKELDYLTLRIEKFRASYNHINSHLDISTRKANEFLRVKGQYKQLIRNAIKIIDCYRYKHDNIYSNIETQELLANIHKLNEFCSNII